MIPCTSCERPLTCDACGVLYEPESPDAYAALSRIEVPVLCKGCGRMLVCRWCKLPYDGRLDDDDVAGNLG